MADIPANRFGSILFSAAGRPGPVAVVRTGSPSGDPAADPVWVSTSVCTPRRRPVWLVAGFVLVVAGSFLAAMPHEQWVPLVDNRSSDPRVDEFLCSERCQTLTGVAVAVAGGAVLGAGFLPFVVTSALSGLMLFTLLKLLGIPIAERHIATLAVAIGYLFHAPAGTAPLGARAIIGVMLTAVAGLSVRFGWFHWERWAAGIVRGGPDFFIRWGPLCSWIVVLIFTAIGVAIARPRRARFLIALVLSALAYHCITSGMIHVDTFPTLGGRQVETSAIGNVPMWRFIVAGELVLLVAVLLYQSRGFGLLTIAFALAWMVAGLSLYHEVGTLSAARALSDFVSGRVAVATPVGDAWFIPAQSAQSPAPSRRTPPTDTLAFMGLSGGGLSGMPAGAARETPGGVIRPAPTANTGAAGSPITSEAAASPDQIEQARRAALRSIRAAAPAPRTTARNHAQDSQRSERQTQIREVTLVAWMVATAILGGLIAAAGSALVSEAPAYRIALGHGLWLAFGAAAVALWYRSPSVGDQPWSNWLVNLTQSHHKNHLMWLMFCGSMAVAGSWMLRERRREAAWLHTAIAATFIGTGLSLVGIAVLIFFGGFSPLPTWVYCAVAVGQSSLAWALLMGTGRFVEPAGERAGAAELAGA